MSALERATTSDPDWDTAPAPEAVSGAYTAEQGLAAWDGVVSWAAVAQDAATGLARKAPDGARSQIEGGMADDVVALIAVLQDIRRSLAETEAYLAREVGRDEMAPREGVLPDGRQFTVKRGLDRKAWQHDDWKRDVRAQVLSGVDALNVVDASTGEQVNVTDLLVAVQEAHGSAAPRVTALKRLGLDPADYCETYPGPFSVQVSAPGTTDND